MTEVDVPQTANSVIIIQNSRMPRHRRPTGGRRSLANTINRAVSAEAVKTLVQEFISCRLDYCNSLFYGITECLMDRLQSVQNAAARLVSGARRYDHITPVL